MNLVSIFSFKMPLQILYLSVGFKKHLSNKALSRWRIRKGVSAEQHQLWGLLAPKQALRGVGRGGRISVAPWPCSSPAHQNTPISPLVTAQNVRLGCGPVPSAWDAANPSAAEAEAAGSLLCPRRTDLGCQCCPWQDSAGALGVIREPQLSCANRAAPPRAPIRVFLLLLWKDTAEGSISSEHRQPLAWTSL